MSIGKVDVTSSSHFESFTGIEGERASRIPTWVSSARSDGEAGSRTVPLRGVLGGVGVDVFLLSECDRGIRAHPRPKAQSASGWFGVRTNLQSLHHEPQECRPIREVDVSSQSAHVLEESFACGQGGSDESVVFVGQSQHRMEQEGKDVQGRQQRGKVLFTVTEIMFQMIALGLESVVVLVLNLPTSPTRSRHFGHILDGDEPVGYPGTSPIDTGFCASQAGT